jgi:hypothetical protein
VEDALQYWQESTLSWEIYTRWNHCSRMKRSCSWVWRAKAPQITPFFRKPLTCDTENHPEVLGGRGAFLESRDLESHLRTGPDPRQPHLMWETKKVKPRSGHTAEDRAVKGGGRGSQPCPPTSLTGQNHIRVADSGSLSWLWTELPPTKECTVKPHKNKIQNYMTYKKKQDNGT